MRTQILALALLATSASAFADPTLIATSDTKGGVSFEFVADASEPVAAFNIELPLLVKSKQLVTVSESCFTAPAGFTAICNVDNGVFKAIVYTTKLDGAMPSASLGRVQFPVGVVSAAKSGEIDGLKLLVADSQATTKAGEVLSESAGRDSNPGSTRQK